MAVDVEDRPGVLADLTREIARAGVNLDLGYVAAGFASSPARPTSVHFVARWMWRAEDCSLVAAGGRPTA